VVLVTSNLNRNQNWILAFFVFLILLLPAFFGLRIISNSSLVKERLINEENDKIIQNAKNEAVIMKREAEKRLNAKIKSFMDNNPL
jgi:sensor domain CHASE-containing protein